MSSGPIETPTCLNTLVWLSILTVSRKVNRVSKDLRGGTLAGVVEVVEVVEKPLPCILGVKHQIAYCSTYLSRSLVALQQVSQHINLNHSQSEPYMCVLRTKSSLCSPPVSHRACFFRKAKIPLLPPSQAAFDPQDSGQLQNLAPTQPSAG